MAGRRTETHQALHEEPHVMRGQGTHKSFMNTAAITSHDACSYHQHQHQQASCLIQLGAAHTAGLCCCASPKPIQCPARRNRYKH